MKIWRILLPVAAFALVAGPVNAQSAEEEDRQAMEARKAEYAERLREAEERLEIAAREIAEITRERLPQMVEIQRRVEFSGKPRLGIMIEGDDAGGPVEGVEIKGVTPGTAADDAGLRSGDIITAVGGNSLSAANSAAANKILLKSLEAIEDGDALQVEFLRGGNVATVEVVPRVSSVHAFAWAPDGQNLHFESMPGVPNVVREFKFEGGFPFVGGIWGSMELIELNEGLGKYFGTDKGLLVISAPELEGLELQDGDVIQSIDGRAPTDVRHALRILSSYESGEKLELGIMRDKKKRTLEIEMPADHRSSLFAPPAVKPVRAPMPARPAAPPQPPIDDVST